MELSTQTVASTPPDANPSSDLFPNLPIHREEGELSSADEDENHDVSPPESVGIADPSARADPTPQKAGIFQGNEEERLNLGNPSSKSVTVLVQTSQPNYEKTSGTSQIQHKAVPPKIGFPQDNNNLVISFSDDESSSDSDENRQTRHLKNKGRIDGVYNNQKSSTLATQVIQKFGQAPTKENPRISKQMSLSHKLAPLLPKNPGVGNRKDGIVSTGRGSLSRNFTANRRLGNQELGYDYVVGSRHLKLQDLRQQIAIRENELKRKSVHLNKQSSSGSGRDSAALKVNRDLVRKHQLKSADAREPDRPIPKRLKVDAPSFAQKNLEVHLLPSKCIAAPKELMLEKGNKGVVDGGTKTSSTGVAQRRIVRWKNKDTGKLVAGSGDLNSNKQAGTKITTVDRGTGTSVDPCPLSNQSLPTDTVTPNTLPNSSGGLDSTILWNSLGKTSASENVNLEIQSLTEMEGSIDKELEDAQEYRRRCEIEERNALKAYCKAQRALIEANLRCTHLYRQRELYSSRLRSFIMNDSFLFGSSNGQDYSRVQMNSSYNMSENLNLMPSSSNHLQSEYDQFNQLGYAPNIQVANFATFSSSFDHANGQNIGSEPCSEPDASTSEPVPVTGRTLVHGESSPSNYQCISGDEDEEYFAFEGKQSKQNVQTQRTHSTESGQDSLLLEATLRSELFAQFEMKSKQNSRSLLNTRSAVEQRSESNIGSEKNQVSNGNVPISESERTVHSSEEGSDREVGDVLDARIHLKHQSHAEKSLEPNTSHDDEGNKYPESCCKSLICSTSNLRSAFHHVMSETQFGIAESHKQFRVYGFGADDNAATDSANEGTFSTNLAEHTYIDLFETVASSYSCDAPVDPILPVCMYELRGKCNNDECPWQHIKDLSVRKMSQHFEKDSDATECEVESTPDGEITSPTKHPKCHTPTYLVGLDILKANAHTYDSFAAPSVGKCWQKCFSICLAGSNFLRQVLNADDSILQNNDGRVELFGCWTNQSSYFRNINCRMNELSESPIGDGQSLEIALLLLNQEDGKLEGKKKALSVLSRALEVNPTSVVLWIVYLVFFYIKARPAETDDLYSVSVKHNQASYELWLMYINSRTKLDDRLAAYDEAISALTNHSSEDNQTHTSACILDLFLQMIECLCMSGNAERALQIIIHANTAAECSNTLLSNIVSCLKISDKCVFWVCCVYLVVYRKLPDAIIHQLECEKELLLIEWAPVHSTDEEMRKAFELVDSVRSDFEKVEESLAAHSFALSHVRCLIAVDGVERSRDLLDRYVKMYPTCLELVLMSARVENLDFEDLSFHGFENALSKWPNGASGSQCVWNQYAECALQNGKADFAKELMIRWFGIHGDESMDTSSSSNFDKVYGLLNLSLHKLLQQQNEEAREAMDRALKAADPKTYRQCITEHALLKAESRTGAMLDLLNSYVSDLRAFSVSEPLSRKFIADVKKPRVQQLIRNNILCPVSNNFLLVNSVLETWFGSTLLPHKVGKVKDLVDFVEAVLEISPSNYPLAISMCKVIISREWDTAPSLAFWVSSVLVRSLSHAVPIAPEFVWVEAVSVLATFSGIDAIMEGFYSKALSVHPFSVKLWKSYYRDVGRKSKGDAGSVLEAAREKGVELGGE